MSVLDVLQKFKARPAEIAALVTDLEMRMVAAESEATAARDAHVDALLHLSIDKIQSTLKAVAAADQQIRDIASTLQGARARQAAIAAADAAAIEVAAQAERLATSQRVAELAGQREQAANGIVVALNKYAAERQRFMEQSTEINWLCRKLGINLEPRGSGLDQSVFDGFVNHELGALGLPHGASWTDPHLARPSLVKSVAAAATMIRAAVGRG